MNTYVLGILWALGSYEEYKQTYSHYFLIRHTNPYFLQVVRQELALRANIHVVRRHDKPQYRLKIFSIDMEYFNRLGWHPRNAVERNYPSLVDGHSDFIRAYLEIHTRFDILTIRNRKKKPSRRLRLRIYGNMQFLTELTNVLACEVGTGVKKPQLAKNRMSELSGALYYQSLRELRSLFKYLYQPPIEHFDREYYKRFFEVLRKCI